MSGSRTLIVAILRDSALRSALAAQLSLLGVELITATSVVRADRARARRPAVLVIDEAGVHGVVERWIDALHASGDWQRVAVLADAAADTAERPWLTCLDRAMPASNLAQHIAKWAKIDLDQAA